MPTPHGNISYHPTIGLSYEPSEPRYWEPAALAMEVERVFEVCHGCRLCFKFCDSFPNLFDALDRKYDGDVRRLTGDDVARVMDACFQCKLCEVQCPYTPREGHEFKLDFPRLVHRYRAQERRRKGLTLRARLLGNPDLAGRLARLSLGLANVFNRLPPVRWAMEKVLGIHRRKLLPRFAATTFTRWAQATGRTGRPPGGEAVLFPTCFVEHNQPELGRDTVFVLEKNGIDLRLAPGLVCCGMPAWERGDLESVRDQARTNLAVLGPYVAAGAKVVAINPTCSMVLRRELAELVEPADRAAAAALARAVVDPSELLWSIRDQPRFASDFRSTPGGTVSYHVPCHLRAQHIGFKGRDLVRRIPGVTPATVAECCGHDGTYAMTVEGFEPSCRIGRKAFDGMKEAGGEVWASDCPLAALQFEQHAGRKPLHPMTILARAYREGGFSTPVKPGAPEGRP